MMNLLKSKLCTKSKRLGHKKVKTIENNEIKKKRFFVANEDSDSKDEKEN
jgi:hypothetical protein